MAPAKKTEAAEQIISATENTENTEIFNIVIPVKLVLRKESIGLSNAPQSSIGALFEIGPRFEDSEKLTRRDLRSLRDKFASSLIGFELALFSGTAKMSFLS